MNPLDSTDDMSYDPIALKAMRDVLAAECAEEVLSVEYGADADSLKKAYRKLSLKIHPDKFHHPDATKAFQKLSAAYDLLSDPVKVSQYRRQKEAKARSHNQQPQYSAGFARGAQKAWSQSTHSQSGGWYDDMFDALFRKRAQEVEKRQQAREKKWQEHGRCEAKTRQGIQCLNKPTEDSKYCQVHEKFDPATYVKPEPPKPLRQCNSLTNQGVRCKKQTTELFCSVHKNKPKFAK